MEFFAEAAETPDIIEKLTEHTPENPFCTRGFFTAMQTLGMRPWIMGLREGDKWVSAGGVFIRSGRLNRVAEIVSLPSAAADRQYWLGLRAFCLAHRVTHIDGGSYASPTFSIPSLANEVSRSPRYEHIIDLAVAELSRPMSKKHLQRFRKASSLGLTLRRSVSEEACNEHRSLVQASLKRRRERGEDVDVGSIDRTSLVYLKAGCGELFQAVLEGAVLSSALVLLAPAGAYYQTSGSTQDGMALGSSDFLIHSIAEALQDQGLRSFNLGGATPGSSLADFKNRFGGHVVESEAVRLDMQKPFRRALTKLAKVAHRFTS